MGDFAIVNATLVRPDRDRVSVRCERGDVVVRAGRVESLGSAPDGLARVDAEGRLVTPGFVDPHTHATFLGDRSAEFCARAAGASYLELAQRGGGIVATVGPTRCGSRDARVERLRARLARLAQNGVTTVEVKSGYGLDEATELALLEELAGVDDPLLPRVLPTLMAAHALPPEFGAHPSQAQRAQWVDAIVHRLIPETARRRLAARVDVFVEQAAFTQAEAERIAAAARTHGLALHLHVDQLTAGAGAQFAARVGAQAVAHLERTDESGVMALAASGAVAILLPTSTLAAREPGFAPARALVDAGVPVALSTNLNPGTGPTESTSLMLFLASVGLRLTPEESLWAATRGGARALGIEAGLLEPGADADLVLWNAREPSHLAYHAAVNHVRTVWRAGRVVAERPQAALDCDGVL
jgi:imidazolonepropionase